MTFYYGVRQILVLVAAAAIGVSAQTFFPTNRYWLSDAYLDKVHSHVIADTGIVLFSLPQHAPKLSSVGALHVLFGAADTVAFRPYLVGAAESGESAIGYGILGVDVVVRAALYNAYVAFTLYTHDSSTILSQSDNEYERFFALNDEHISGMPKFGMLLSQAYVEFIKGSISVSTGKRKMRWGPGYKGTLGLSGVGFAPFCFYNARIGLGKHCAFSCFFAGLDDEVVFREYFSQDTIQGSLLRESPRYLAGHRLDFVFGKHLQAGLFEFADFYGTKDLIRYANPLQMYYVAQNTGSAGVNLLGGCDINLLFGPIRAYAELLNDDMTFFDKCGNPNKYAYQVGLTYYAPCKLRQVGFEYTHIAPYVYGNEAFLSRHSYFGKSLGWPWGNDQDIFTTHAMVIYNSWLRSRFEINYRINGLGRIEDDWYADGIPNLEKAPYWPQNAVKELSALINASIQPASWLHIDATYKPSMLHQGTFNHEFYVYLQVQFPGQKTIRF